MATSGNDRVVVVAVRKCSSICSRRSMRSSSSNNIVVKSRPATPVCVLGWQPLPALLSPCPCLLLSFLLCCDASYRKFTCAFMCARCTCCCCYCICCLPACLPACLRAQLVRVELRPATTPVFTSLRVCLCVCVCVGVVVAGIFASRLLIQHFAYSRVVQFAIIRSN